MQRSEIHARAVLAIVFVSYTMIVLDISIVITALPKIDYALGFSATALSWVQNAYLLTFGGLLLLGAGRTCFHRPAGTSSLSSTVAPCAANEARRRSATHHTCIVAERATLAWLLLRCPGRPKEKPRTTHLRPMTRLVVRESSSELVIDRSLASRAVRMQLTGLRA